MPTTATLDNSFLAELLNGDELELDLSFDNFSPNPSFVSEFVMQFVCTANNDPISFFDDWVKQNSIIKDVPCTLNTNDFTLPGNAKLSSGRNAFIYDQGQKTQYNILFEPFVNNFFEKAKNKNLNTFITNDDLVIVRYITERNNPLEDIVILQASYMKNLWIQIFTLLSLVKNWDFSFICYNFFQFSPCVFRLFYFLPK